MAVRIDNRLPSPDYRRNVDQAVKAAIGDRRGDWVVFVRDCPEIAEWWLSIEGPNGFNWQREFLGVEQSGRFIRQQVERHLPNAA